MGNSRTRAEFFTCCVRAHLINLRRENGPLWLCAMHSDVVVVNEIEEPNRTLVLRALCLGNSLRKRQPQRVNVCVLLVFFTDLGALQWK